VSYKAIEKLLAHHSFTIATILWSAKHNIRCKHFMCSGTYSSQKMRASTLFHPNPELSVHQIKRTFPAASMKAPKLAGNAFFNRSD